MKGSEWEVDGRGQALIGRLTVKERQCPVSDQPLDSLDSGQPGQAV